MKILFFQDLSAARKDQARFHNAGDCPQKMPRRHLKTGKIIWSRQAQFKHGSTTHREDSKKNIFIEKYLVIFQHFI